MLHHRLSELSLVLVGHRRMAAVHRYATGQSDSTDVLSFALDLDSRARPVSGEIVISVPVARRQAKRRGIPVEHELLLYALHGMLHLCGFDDRTQREFQRMHRTEDRILSRLGVGPVFYARRATRRQASSRGGARP